MAATQTKVNTIPYDYKTTGVTGFYDSEGSLTQSFASGEQAAFGFNTNDKTLFVTSGGVSGQYGLTFTYYFDAAVDGLAVGNINFRGVPLPAGFRICNAIWEPTTAFTSGGSAQISIGTDADVSVTNLLGAAVLGTNGTTGAKQCVPDWATLADSVKVAVESMPVLAVSVADLLVGKGVLIIQGYMSVADSIA